MHLKVIILAVGVVGMCSGLPVAQEGSGKRLEREPAPVYESGRGLALNGYQGLPGVGYQQPARLLGVVYSAAPQVSHMVFDGFGVRYEY